MPEVRFIPPADEVKAMVAAIPGSRFTPGVVVAQEGRDGHLGPEAAGAVLILQVTSVDEEAAGRFWQASTAVKQQLPTAPGFIRLFSLADGPCGYLVAFWRTVEDAQAFSRDPRHRAAMEELHVAPFQYSHFVGLWKAHSVHPRQIFCDRCGAATTAPTDSCSRCGNALHDVHREGGGLR